MTARDEAERLLDLSMADIPSDEARAVVRAAQVHAQLATADAINRLTAVLEGLQFPTLEVKKCLSSMGYSIRPKR